MSLLTQIHAAGRFDRSLSVLERTTAAQMQAMYAMAVCQLLTVTETAGEHREAVYRKLAKTYDWGFVSGDKGGNDDSGILYNRDRSTHVASGTSPVVSPRPGDDPDAAWLVSIDNVTGHRCLDVVFHMPHGVEKGGRFKPANDPMVKRWKAEFRALQDLWNDLAAEHRCTVVRVSCDWNVNLRSKYFRDWFKANAPGMRVVFTNPVPDKGTHGSRLIDFVLVRGPIDVTAARVLAKTKASDHSPIAVTYRPKETPMTNINTRVIARARAMGGDVRTRAQWGSTRASVYAARRKTKPAKQPADTLAQHITVTFDSGTLVGDFNKDMRTIERIGYERFKSGTSYNWCVDMATGMIGEGQPLDAKGTHTVNDKKQPGYSRDQNFHARAIAVLGMPANKLTDAGKRGIATIYAAMILEGALTADPDYKPHSFFTAKDCPSDSTRNAMPEIRRMALALVKEHSKPKPAPKPKPKPAAKTRGDHVDHALADIAKAAKYGTPGSSRRRALETAAKALQSLPQRKK